MNRRLPVLSIVSMIMIVALAAFSLAQSPPNYANLPAVKLFIGDTTDSLFSLEDYNTGGAATTGSWAITGNFAGLAGLNGSTVTQATYGSPTVGSNSFQAANAGGLSNIASNTVKYSTYKINKLPIVGLTVGSSYTLNLTGYTNSVSGPAIPVSYNTLSALSVDNYSNVTASWSGNTAIVITALQAFSDAAHVYVTASPSATPPYDGDLDMEDVQVYTNLLTSGTFSTANDTAVWSPMEIPPGRSTLATQQWMQSYTDSAGTQAQGVWKFTFADANGGVKSTPNTAHWISIANGEWYIYRIHLVADTPNNTHLACLYCYTNLPGSGTQTDIVGNVLFGVPTVWTWQEAPLLAHGSSTTGYPQFQFKANGAGSIYVDEIQIINATPELMQARSNTHSHYLYGQFTTGNDTTGWGQELYFGAVSAPSITVNNGLVLNFAGAAPGSSGQEGIKWTANNGVQGPLHAYSFPDNVGHQVGTQLTLSIVSGNFNTLGIVLVAAYGTATAGDQDIDNLIAAAGVGVLVSGNYYAIGEAQYPYAQGQFGLRSDAGGILEVNNVDVNVDNDDPFYGDGTLFP